MSENIDLFITRKKSNTFNFNPNLISENNDPLEKPTDVSRSLQTKTKAKEKKSSLDYSNDGNSKIKIIDFGGEMSSSHDKTKEIDLLLLLSDPDLMDDVEDKIIYSDDSRSVMQKLISKLDKGSLCRIVINLSIHNICISSLNLSQKMIYTSFYIYPILIIIVGIISHWTLNIISKISTKYKKKSYEGIIKEILFKQLIPVYIFLVILNNFGNIILEEMILYKLILDITTKFFGDKPLSKKKLKYFILCGISFFILFPIFQFIINEKFGKILVTELFFLLLILLIILLNYILLFIHKFDINNIINKFSLRNDFIFSKNEIFNSISVLFYTFSYHDKFFPSLEKLCIPTSKRINKIIKRTVVIDITICLLLTFVGYFSLPFEMIKDLIIFRNSELEEDYALNDYAMIVARILYFFYLIYKMFKDYQILRNTIFTYIFCYKNKKIGRFANLLISFIILLSTTFIVIYYQYISNFISLIAASSSVYISFIIPLIIFINENDYSIIHWKNILTILLTIIIFFISLFSIFFSIRKILNDT